MVRESNPRKNGKAKVLRTPPRPQQTNKTDDQQLMRQARPKYDPRQVMPTDQPPEGATSSDARPVLRFQAIRRTKPTDHLADFDLAGRKKFLKNNGFAPFRADQLSRHYFTHLTTD